MVLETFDKAGNMNFAILSLVLIVVSKTDCYVSEKASSVIEEEGENEIFLKKLQSSIRSDSDEGAVLTWSEVLADVLIKGIKIFSHFNSSPVNGTLQEVSKENMGSINIITRFCSQILDVYKILVYDKLFRDRDLNGATNKAVTQEFENELGGTETVTEASKEDFGIITINPDVEIIAPKYHSRLCDDCDEINIEKKKEIPINEDCPEGLKKDANGNCGDPKSSNFILAVPFHCPLGYKADWFGICRMRF